MTAINVIKKCAVILNIQEILNDNNLTTLNAENEQTILSENLKLERMFEILKIMLNDIATDYVQIVKEIELNVENNEIAISSIPNFMHIAVILKNNVNVPYRIANSKIILKNNGKHLVRYYAQPNLTSLLGDVNLFDGRVGEDLLVYGLASLYCLAFGMFNEFDSYNAIYNQKLSTIKQLKIINMAGRRWE